jgi:hypothetical protein
MLSRSIRIADFPALQNGGVLGYSHALLENCERAAAQKEEGTFHEAGTLVRNVSCDGTERAWVLHL